MRHQRAGRKLGRTTSHRWAMFRNMLTSFFEWEKIETTTAKAKELRPLAEKIITLGKRGDLAARREVRKLVANKKIIRKIFDEIAPTFKERLGGYTRIIRAGFRPGDCAPMSIIEIVSEEKVAKPQKGLKKKKTPKPKTETEKGGKEKTGQLPQRKTKTKAKKDRKEKKEIVEETKEAINIQETSTASEKKGEKEKAS